jgi:hypothetical protein
MLFALNDSEGSCVFKRSDLVVVEVGSVVVVVRNLCVFLSFGGLVLGTLSVNFGRSIRLMYSKRIAFGFS